MSGSIDYVLQPDGTYKWEVVEPKTEVSPAPKTTKKKLLKRKLIVQSLNNQWQSKKK